MAAKRKTTKKRVQTVNFGIRLVAALIDGVVMGVGTNILRSPFRYGMPYGRSGWLGTVVGALYAILLWVNWNGQTLGKKAMGIKVVRVDGKPLDYSTAILRYIGYIISAMPVLLGYFWVIWDEKKQGWHDKIAKTLVVKA